MGKEEYSKLQNIKNRFSFFSLGFLLIVWSVSIPIWIHFSDKWSYFSWESLIIPILAGPTGALLIIYSTWAPAKKKVNKEETKEKLQFSKYRRMDETEKLKLAHNSLLKEIHNIDRITETHTGIVIAILVALIAFVSYQLRSQYGVTKVTIVIVVSIVGILIGVEWILKVIRHRHIFRTCYDKLTELQDKLGIDALRPLPKPYKKLFSFDGFTILIWLAILFLLFWNALALLVAIGWI